MSGNILKALMQLFAIIAKVDELSEVQDKIVITSSKGRKIVKLFLRQELNAELVDTYLLQFDEFLTTHHSRSKRKDGKRKRTSVNSVKVLRICSQINEELTQRQKIIVLVRIIEFINANEIVTEQELDFLDTVSEAFYVNPQEYKNIKNFTERADDYDCDDTLYITSSENNRKFKLSKQITVKSIDKSIGILYVNSVNLFFISYQGKDELTLNGQVVPNTRLHIFNQGSSFRTPKTSNIYYSDIISQFLTDANKEKLSFHCNKVQYQFKSGKIGLHDIDFKENDGKLLGIMGGSGAGKSTLLNVLNGNYNPSAGSVTINGIDIHKEKDKIEGVIGFVSQDDLLIEELSVFQNLYFNAKLCFNDLTPSQIARKVVAILKSIGLFESKDLKVGSPLEKTISGGQRKRLNIALELIREPSVLFVDEPTSGLSSRDSENIMDLLKELALKGKLVFVVIHQPSSEIFKMFDKLMILDMGGYPIYYGNPIDGIVHFKTLTNHVNCNERECPTCGNVNPEQIFNIIESKVVDEYGNLTSHRKTSPKEWNKKYIESIKEEKTVTHKNKPNISFGIPGKWKQFTVYFKRDILSKLSNKQYLIINTIEAPILALLLAFFVKFFNFQKGEEFLFSESENLPQFLFISVVVALFIGLTVAAEEIIKDQKILKRESFLNLSKTSYLLSKITILFIISAFQTLLFVAVGNFILEIKGMWLEYWAILFSTSCFANLLGLNISATFNSAKVIYILIPIMIIPQLIFSGVIVKFDKLHPQFKQEDSVPWIGNIMASRWAFEALSVTQYRHNKYEAPYFNFKVEESSNSWKRDYWVPEMKTLANTYFTDNATDYKYEIAKQTLINEINNSEYYCEACTESIEQDAKNKKLKTTVYALIEATRKSSNKLANNYSDSIQLMIKVVGDSVNKTLKQNYFNKSLEEFVTNRNELNKIVNENNKLIQKDDPIYLSPKNKGFTGAHFYAPEKNFFGTMIDTFWANIMMIWFMTLLFSITLYLDLFRKIIEAISNISLKKH